MERKIEWTKVETGLYRNHESGVEIEKIGGRWETTRPLSIQSNGNERAWQRSKHTFREARDAAEQMWVVAVHRPMVAAAYDEAIMDELTREAGRARQAGVTHARVQSILDEDTTVERKLSLVSAFADDAERLATPGGFAASIMDGSAHEEADSEDEEVLRDVIVAQVMQWAELGCSGDTHGIQDAAANLRTWMAAHPS
jgi:hypothetical protein